MKELTLSVIVVVGPERDRCVPLLEALGGQTIADRIEIILVDIGDAPLQETGLPNHIEFTILHHQGEGDWGGARAAGVRAARAAIVAFVEDHTVPEPRWAEEIVGAFDRHGGQATAACYAFVNGSPDSYFYRSVFLAEYGALAVPLPEGKPLAPPSNNIAYRRDLLLALDQKLDDLMEMDFFCHRYLGASFKPVTVPAARIAHKTNVSLMDLVIGHFHYSRLFANRRLIHEPWPVGKRLLGVLAVPFLVPPLRLKRLFLALRHRGLVRDAAMALPIILLLFIAGALGEASGLARSRQLSASKVIWLELVAPRAER